MTIEDNIQEIFDTTWTNEEKIRKIMNLMSVVIAEAVGEDEDEDDYNWGDINLWRNELRHEIKERLRNKGKGDFNDKD